MFKPLAGSALLAFMLGASPVQAQAQCGLTLVFAIDVSSSVDASEYGLQMGGLARALRDRDVMNAIADIGGVQAMAFEWSGRNQQVEIAPWQLLLGPDDVLAFSTRLENHPRQFDEFPTALGYALGYASVALQKAPLQCARRVVDVSGDGVTNAGYPPPLAYSNFPFDGVQVNAMVISGADPDPVAHYREQVIYGAGAFVEVAFGFADYQAAMKRKLLREIRGAALSQR